MRFNNIIDKRKMIRDKKSFLKFLLIRLRRSKRIRRRLKSWKHNVAFMKKGASKAKKTKDKQ